MCNTRLSIRPTPSDTAESVSVPLSPKEFSNQLNKVAFNSIDQLQLIWKEAGYEESECECLLGELLEKFGKMFAGELTAESQILEHAKKLLVDNFNQYCTCCTQLGRPHPEGDSSMGTNLTDKLAELDRLLEVIKAEIFQRQLVFQVEFDEIAKLVQQLGEVSPSPACYSGPEGTPEYADIRLSLLRKCRSKLEAVKADTKSSIKNIGDQSRLKMIELVMSQDELAELSGAPIDPDVDVAICTLMSSNKWIFEGIHKNDVLMFQQRCDSLDCEIGRRRTDLATTGAEIARLWTLLRIPSVEREAFQSSFQMNLSAETLATGHRELARLHEVRSTSMDRVVTSIRQDIAELWGEMGIESKEDRTKEFPLYFESISEINDAAVDLHEEYFNLLKLRVEELRPILNKVSKREITIQERIELEHIQLNPERLTARGPKAREDRKREEAMSNRVRNLDKLSKELVLALHCWEELNGPFMYAGERYSHRMQLQEENYVEIRDSLRNARKKTKDPGISHIAPPRQMRKLSACVSKDVKIAHKEPTKVTTAVGHALCSTKSIAELGASASNENQVNGKNHAVSASMDDVLERSSMGSNDSMCTSFTEVRDRASTCTVVKSAP